MRCYGTCSRGARMGVFAVRQPSVALPVERRMKERRTLLSLMAALAAVSCASEEEAPLGSSDLLVEVGQIESGESPDDLGVRIQHVAARPDGGDLIADRHAARVRLFDSAGRRAGVVGGLAVASSRPTAAQTTADTVSVYAAVLANHISGPLAGPAGQVASVCDVTSAKPPGLVARWGHRPLFPDTLPALTPRLKTVIIRLLQLRHGLSMATSCDEFRDESGRQGSYLEFSGPIFHGENLVVVYSAMRLGHRWGTGAACVWERSGRGAAWERDRDCFVWVSDQEPRSRVDGALSGDTAYGFLVPDEGHAAVSLLDDRLYTGPLAPYLAWTSPSRRISMSERCRTGGKPRSCVTSSTNTA